MAAIEGPSDEGYPTEDQHSRVNRSNRTNDQLFELNQQLSEASVNGDFDDILACLDAGADVNSMSVMERTPLWKTVFYNRKESPAVVKLLLDRGAKLELRDVDSETPLWRAATEGNEENVKLLLNAKADINAKDRNQDSVLSQAISRGHEKIIRLLMEAGADIDEKDNNGETRLWKSAAAGMLETFKILKKCGADVNVTNDLGSSVLSEAAACSRLEIVRLLLDAHSDSEGPNIEMPNRQGQTPLSRAAAVGDVETVQLLLSRGANANARDEEGTSVLMVAAISGHLEVVKLIVGEVELEVTDNNGRTALWRAIENHSRTCADFLVARGANYRVRDKNNKSLVSVAAASGNRTILESLLSNGHDDLEVRDEDGMTILRQVLSSGDHDCIQLVLGLKPHVDFGIINGSSMLHEAARNSSLSGLQYLLENKNVTDDIEGLDVSGHTALWLALSSGNQECVDILFAWSDSISEQSGPDGTILHHAINHGNQKAVELLIEKGLFTDSTDSDHHTPLWLAVSSGNEHCVKHLLCHTAAINACDDKGVSIIHQAVKNDSLQIVKMLLCEEDGGCSIGQLNTATELNDGTGIYQRSNTTESMLHIPSVDSEDTGSGRGVTGEFRRDKIPDSGRDGLTKHNPKGSQHRRPDINIKDNDNESPLLNAVINNSTETIKLLLKHDPAFDGVDGDGDSELGRAAWHGYQEIVRLLLEAGADPRKANKRQQTPLHWAAKRSKPEVLKALVKYDVDILATDDAQQTAFHHAINLDSLAMIKDLEFGFSRMAKSQPIESQGKTRRELFNKRFVDGDTILHIVARKGDIRIMKFFLDLAESYQLSKLAFVLNDGGSSALHHAVAAKSLDLKIIRQFLNLIDVADLSIADAKGNTALHIACENEYEVMVQQILEKLSLGFRDTAARTNADHETPLSIAVENESLEILQLLIDFEVDVKYTEEIIAQSDYASSKEANEPAEKVVNWATMREDPSHDIRYTGYLLRKMVTGARRTSRHKTLFWAARNGQKKLVHLLFSVEKTESVDSKLKEGKVRETLRSLVGDALYWAAVGDQRGIVDFLFEVQRECFEIQPEEIAGRAVRAAAGNGYLFLARHLIEKLTQINPGIFSRKKDYVDHAETWTPIHWAINYKPKEAVDIVRSMVVNGADPWKAPKGGISPITLMKALGEGTDRWAETDDYNLIWSFLRTPLKVPPKVKAMVEPATNHSEEAKKICESFYGNVVDFQTTDSQFFTIESQSETTINDIIYDQETGPHSLMDKAKSVWNLKHISVGNRLRWIHLPANNWSWAEDLMSRIAIESGKPAREYSRLSKFVDLNKKERKGKPQCRFMYPALTFESKEFHSAEGVDLMKLLAEAKQRKKRDEKKKSEVLPENEQNPTKDNVELKLESKGDKTATGESKISDGQSAVVQPIRTTDEVDDDKTKKGSLAHLQGSRLSLFMPYVTSQSVASHRALRQAMRLAIEVIQARKVRAIASDPRSKVDVLLGKSKALHPITTGTSTEDEYRQTARNEILDSEITIGVNLLKGLGNQPGSVRSEFYYKLKYFQYVRSTSGKINLDWVALKDFHRNMRRNKTLCGSYEISEWLERFFDAIEIAAPRKSAHTDNDPMHEELLAYYLDPNNSKGLHLSRTLDQFYYAALENTNKRDVDQVVRRLQAKIKARDQEVRSDSPRIPKAETSLRELRGRKKQEEQEKARSKSDEIEWEDDPEAQIVMVDQLWLWITDDETMITCFPKQWCSDTESNGRYGDDLLDRIRHHIHTERRPQISSVYHLATIVASKCVSHIEHCKATAGDNADGLLDMFADSIGLAADKEVALFEAFKVDLTKTASSSGQLNIEKEIRLLEEVKDIRDELNILRTIFEDQKALLNKLASLIEGPNPQGEHTTTDPVVNYYQERCDIDLRIEKVKKMDKDAEKTYQSINHLLDLKQKTANLNEAAKASERASVTMAQGRTMMVFTLVTIVFLPLSFLTSLYALNVDSFPHRGDNFIFSEGWIYPRIFGTSAAIGIPLILIAININPILNMYKKRFRPPIAEYCKESWNYIKPRWKISAPAFSRKREDSYEEFIVAHEDFIREHERYPRGNRRRRKFSFATLFRWPQRGR